MKVNTIKETVEKVVRTDYIAEDGKVFHNEEECKKYEESALFVLSQDLKMKKIRKCDCMNDGYDEEYVRVFEVPTEQALEKLKRYLHLKATEGLSVCQGGEWKSGFDLSSLTYGRKIITFWNWEDAYCTIFGDGSIEAYADYTRELMENAITKAYTDSKEK